MKIKKGNRTQMINKNSSYGGACGTRAITSTEEKQRFFSTFPWFPIPPNSTFYNIVLVFSSQHYTLPNSKLFALSNLLSK